MDKQVKGCGTTCDCAKLKENLRELDHSLVTFYDYQNKDLGPEDLTDSEYEMVRAFKLAEYQVREAKAKEAERIAQLMGKDPKKDRRG